MRTRSSSNLPVVSPSNPSTSNPKRRNRIRSKQPFILEESPIDTMADQRTMAELLRAPTEGYAEAIVAWDRYKDLLRACPHHGFTELLQLDTFYNALNPVDQDSLNAAAGGNLLERELRDNIQGYVSAAAVNYNQGNSVYRPPCMANQIRPPGFAQPNVKNNQNRFSQPQGSGSLPSNTIANPKGELKAITTQSGIVLDGPSVPTPPPFINPEVDERVEETLTNQDLFEYTIKVPPPPVKKYKPPSQIDFVKMLKALLSNKEKLQELANTPLNENCTTVILKKLLEKLEDLGKFLISCGFNEFKCKALADLSASINLMPLSIWKKLGLPELISTCMTLELANRAICTQAGIARDVFVSVGKFTFLADFIIVDYESDPRVPLNLRRPFLQTARALIDVHGEKMILCDGDERLTLNMRNDTSSYSNQPQKESINLINVFNNSSEDFLEDSFSTNQPSGNPTFSSHPELTLSEVKDDIFDSEGGNVLPEKLLDLDSTEDLYPPLHVNPLSGSTTYSSPSQLLEEFADELALITFPPKYDDDLQLDNESDLKEIEYLLYHDPIKDIDSILKDSIDQSNLVDLDNNFVDSMPEMFTDEHALDYSSPSLFDEYDDDLFEIKSDIENFYDDPFDSQGEKIKESKLLINELDLPCDFLLPSEYDSFLSEDFSRVDALPSTNNEDKLAISHASWMLEDFDPPLYELTFLKEVPKSKILLPFSSENEEKVLKPGIHTSEKVHSSFITKLSHQG
nr:reverse transcriptase domain-containing protein [Tanacetum cinerariifolium]